VADKRQVRISNMFIRNGSRGLSIEDSSDITVDQVNLIGFDGPYGISIKGTDETTRNVAMYRVSGSDLGGGNEVCATNQDLSWLRIEGDVDTIDIIEPLFIRGDYGIEVMAGNAANTSGTIRLENWGTDNTCAPSIVARSGDYTIDAIMPWIGQVNEGDGVTALAAFSGTLTMKNPTIRGAYRNGVSMGGGTVEITNPLIGNNGQMFRQTGEGSFAGIHIRQSAALARIFGGVSGMLYNGNVRIDRDDPELDVSAAPGNNGQNFGIRIDNARSQVGGVDVDWNIRDGVLRTN